MIQIITTIKHRISLLVVTSLFFASCSDFLEITPKGSVSDQTAWQSTANADLFLNGVYARLDAPLHTIDPVENFSDNAVCSTSQSSYSRDSYSIGAYDPSNPPLAIWGQCYGSIRACNVFIQNVEATNLDNEWKKVRLAEARFLRAYFYHLLWMQYGGIPIIKDVLDFNAQGETIFRARNTDDETYSFIVAELQAVVPDLPLNAEMGRITKGAALTLEAWCELFKASPLKNSANNKALWTLAATTYKKVIDLGIYQLFSDYETLFYDVNNNNKEVIFAKQVVKSAGGSREGLLGPALVNGSIKSWNCSVPSQELVDEYSMSNGLVITDPASGYDPQNPYKNREKRFYQSICYTGSSWLGFNMIIPIQTSEQGGSVTGYYWRKTIDPQYCANGDNGLSGANWPYFRYAEVLLGYAEAMNEVNGPSSEVYNAINQVRKRSNLPDLSAGLTQDKMRTAIHRERRVELAFEEKRWYDLIRLKLAESKINGDCLHGMRIDKQNDGTYTYTVIRNTLNIIKKFDPSKNYLLPIPQYSLSINNKLIQNPNY